MTRRDAVERHARCEHAKACRRIISLPTMCVVAVGEGGVIAEALLCDCCPEYRPRKEPHG